MTNLHIPSEALFFKMFLTHYVLLGIFMFLCPDFLFPDYESIVHSTVCYFGSGIAKALIPCSRFTVQNLALH